MAYIGGWYRVTAWTIKGYPFSKEFPTEQEARDFGNSQWKLPYVCMVKNTKMGFRNKRRHSVLVAEAEKNAE